MLPISKSNKSGTSKSKRPYLTLHMYGLDCDSKELKGNPSQQNNLIAVFPTLNSVFQSVGV